MPQQLKVKIIPRASRNQVIGWEDDVLKIKLTAVPIKGKANQALIKLLAKKFKVPQQDIQIIKGANSRNKVLNIPNSVIINL